MDSHFIYGIVDTTIHAPAHSRCVYLLSHNRSDVRMYASFGLYVGVLHLWWWRSRTRYLLSFMFTLLPKAHSSTRVLLRRILTHEALIVHPRSTIAFQAPH